LICVRGGFFCSSRASEPPHNGLWPSARFGPGGSLGFWTGTPWAGCASSEGGIAFQLLIWASAPTYLRSNSTG